MSHNESSALSWYEIEAIFDEDHLAINGVEKDIPDARFQLNSSAPLASAFFDLFTWRISVDKKARDVMGNNLSWLIFSSRAKNAVENLPKLNAEFLEFPQAILKKSKYKCSAWLFHPFAAVRAINLERSKVAWDNYGGGDFISVVYELWLDQSIVSQCPTVFRLAESPSTILANGDFVAAWNKAGCTGLDFVRVGLA